MIYLSVMNRHKPFYNIWEKDKMNEGGRVGGGGGGGVDFCWKFDSLESCMLRFAVQSQNGHQLSKVCVHLYFIELKQTARNQFVIDVAYPFDDGESNL